MSQRLDLDYVEQSHFSFSRFSPMSILLCLLGVFVAIAAYNHFQYLEAEYTRVAQHLNNDEADIKAQIAKNKLAKENFSEAELKKIRATVADLSTPWDDLLASLEGLDMQGVGLLSLEPNKNKKQVMLTGEAKNIESMLNYVESVSTLPMLSKVYLQNHMIELDAPNQPVSFTIAADWNE